MFEHVFEHVRMTVSPLVTQLRQASYGSTDPRRHATAERLDQARRSAERARRLQGERISERLLDILPALASLLPDGGLKLGSAYAVEGSTALTAVLIARATATGSWCGVVGMPEFAAEGAAGLGVDLDHVVMVPEPGRGWINVVAALVDALTVIVIRPPGHVSDAEAARLGARLRRREAVLVSCGPWPRCEARLTVSQSSWIGLGSGHGHLRARQVEVTVSGRGTSMRPRRTPLWLPDACGQIRLADPTATSSAEELSVVAHDPSAVVFEAVG